MTPSRHSMMPFAPSTMDALAACAYPAAGAVAGTCKGLIYAYNELAPLVVGLLLARAPPRHEVGREAGLGAGGSGAPAAPRWEGEGGGG
jgi:hypothetical protein